jgi:hypothetical protein
MRAKRINESKFSNQAIKRFEGIVTTKAQHGLISAIVSIGNDILDDGGDLDDVKIFIDYLVNKAYNELKEIHPSVDFDEINYTRGEIMNTEDEDDEAQLSAKEFYRKYFNRIEKI